jgi:hypothetical protein
MLLDLRQEKVDSKNYSVATLYKHVTRTKRPITTLEIFLKAIQCFLHLLLFINE